MPYRKRLRTICLLGYLCIALYASGQVPKGFSEMKNTAQLQSSLSNSAAHTQTITSDFTQVKHMKMLNDKVISKGKFHFKQQDKIRIEYTAPFQYLLIMNGGQIMVKDGEKTNKINTKNSKTMQSVNKVMMDCMKGTVLGNKDFNVRAYESKDQFLLSLIPITPAMKDLFSRIDVFVARSDNSVTKLVMTEKGGDFTDMNFVNKKINIVLADALFSVR